MTHDLRPGELPGRKHLIQACAVAGVDARDARLLHHRSNAVYLLHAERVIVRLSPDTPEHRRRAETSIAVTRWLAEHGDPIALAPLTDAPPVLVEDTVATFWPLRDINPPATPQDLAAPLRRLHTMPDPPFPMPAYQPLHRLHEALSLDQARADPVLGEIDRAWLTERADTTRAQFAATESTLGIGLVHGDAHTGNLVRTVRDSGWVLIDWDHACLGPRELDLVGTLPDHFHQPAHQRRALADAYGHDLTTWPSWTILREVIELHSLASYIRLAPGKPAAATELFTRLRSLRTQDRSVRWRAVS